MYCAGRRLTSKHIPPFEMVLPVAARVAVSSKVGPGPSAGVGSTKGVEAAPSAASAAPVADVVVVALPVADTPVAEVLTEVDVESDAAG